MSPFSLFCWSHLLKKCLMENFVFCTVIVVTFTITNLSLYISSTSSFKGVAKRIQKAFAQIVSSFLKLHATFFTLTEKDLPLSMIALDSHLFSFICLVDSWCSLQNYSIVKVLLNKYISTCVLFNNDYIIFVCHSYITASIFRLN